MAEYEMVREIKNLCRNNQMRDISFEEIETDNPTEYVKSILKGHKIELSHSISDDGSVKIDALCDGLMQTFTFTPI